MAFDRRLAALTLTAGLVLAPALAHAAPPASARDKETARALMDEGDKKLAANDNAAALKAYKAAYALIAVPTTGVAVAKAQAALGQLVEARDTALAVTRYPREAKEPAPFRAARTRADELARSLLPRIPSLQITVTGPPAGAVVHVEVDGTALPDDAATLPTKVNPGKHVVVASAEHFSRESKEVMVAEAAQVPVAIALKPVSEPAAAAPTTPVPGTTTATATTSPTPTPSPPAKSNTLAYVGIGVGAVGIAVGSVAGVLSLSKTSSAKEHCTGDRCSSEARADLDSSLLLANVSNIGFGVGVVGAAIFVVAILTADSAPAAPRAGTLTPTFGLGGSGLRGSF